MSKEYETISIDCGIGQRIYDLRKSKKINGKKVTQEELAELAGVEVNTIKRIEKCRNGSTYRTTLFTLKGIADSLNVSVEELLGGVYSDNRKKWAAFVDKWERTQRNNDPWIKIESGSAWDNVYNDMNISCYNYPVDKLITAICMGGGYDLVIKGLREAEKNNFD